MFQLVFPPATNCVLTHTAEMCGEILGSND